MSLHKISSEEGLNAYLKFREDEATDLEIIVKDLLEQAKKIGDQAEDALIKRIDEIRIKISRRIAEKEEIKINSVKNPLQAKALEKEHKDFLPRWKIMSQEISEATLFVLYSEFSNLNQSENIS